MNVFIGPYKNWIGPYQLADKLSIFGVSEDTCHTIGEWLCGRDNDSWILRLCKWIDSKRTRDVSITIDNYDTWNMDSTLALLILPMLKQLRDTKHGSPGDMPAFFQTSNSEQLCFPFYEDGDSLADETGHQQWKDILDEIIWAFEQLQPGVDWEDQYWKVYPEIDFDPHEEDEGKVTRPVRWKVEGECDWEGRRLHGERIQHGLELFGKYYNDLWD